MLNIISRSIVAKHNRGPRKVAMNLMKGLDELGLPYVVNQALDATDQLWIHDDPVALVAAAKLPPAVSVIAGPNIFTLPTEIPKELALDRLLWLHPADWVRDFWDVSSTRKIHSAVWPVGIDTTRFSPTPAEKDIVLVYNKQRADQEIATVLQALEAHAEQYEVITYGKYTEQAYQALLARAKAIVWVGRSESQGIGLLEALATNVPALVCDIDHFGQWTGAGHERFTEAQLAFTGATAATYFDHTCGSIITDLRELPTKLPTFLHSLSSYQPRAYIQSNLSLAKQAEDFASLYRHHFGVSEEALLSTQRRNHSVWRNATWSYRLQVQLKDAVRRVIR